MLRSIKELEGYTISATDGEIGKAYDFFFDNKSWTVRYLVADTGTWLPGKRVLISPHSLGKPDWNSELFPVNLTREQVEKSPDIDRHKPLERREELDLMKYYGWPNYWTGLGSPIFDGIATPPPLPVNPVEEQVKERERRTPEEDANLHSTKSIIDYNVEGTDNSIGHVEDFIVDDDNWTIRYIIVETRNWLPGGKKVIISPSWIKRMDWVDSKVHIDLTADQIKNSPEWQSDKPIEKDYEAMLHEHYGKNKYW